MLDRESFKEYMSKLIAFDNYLDNLDTLKISIWEKEEVEGILNGYIKLLEAILELDVDNNGDSEISFWLYETEHGTADNAWVEVCGKKYYIRTLDELYDWIVFGKEGGQ